MTILRSIPFAELVADESLQGSTVSLLGVEAPKNEEEAQTFVENVTAFFRETGFFSPSLSVVAVSKVLGNVLGEEGRTDLLVHLSGSLSETRPLKRLMFAEWVKWTEDFVVNCAPDYEK